jgi:eukaryotic-like serine/threonine-protein kinase
MNNFPEDEVAIFTEALRLPVSQRAGYLIYACGGDEKLRKRVEALLETHGQVGDFLEQSPQKPAIPTPLETAPSEKVGDWVGRYKLVEQIGEGGCGVVFLAEQEEPVRRQVALKMIKPGMDSKSVIARFESERQALALMDHPNIAKVFDAGTTKCGRPYFVMELIRGVKITEYCDQHALSTGERLKLFVQVCQAVQHAHQKGIIHRDIKPSNILVTTAAQGAASPMVIDFGIAKATTNQLLPDKTLFTAFEMLIGTPAYMSPEQAALTNVDVDTRTDIYSLGVLLYELLTGSTPFDTGHLSKAGFDEIRRVIRDEEPIRPSTRLSSLANADLAIVAQRRNSEPPVLIRAIAGDLDWIVMKALEKDRTRRYETANGLALDVQRYLCDEAISARPPSTLYKFHKTFLRNRFLFASLGVITLFLVASLIVVSVFLAKERRARREAEAATRFLEDMLQGVGPSVARGRDTTMLREILDRTAARVGVEMTNQPEVQAELTSILGRVYFDIAKYDQAAQMQRSALTLNQRLFGQESPEAADSLDDLGQALMRGNNLSAAQDAHEAALRIRRKRFGEENASVAQSLDELATVYRHEGRPRQAEPLILEGLSIRQQLFGTNSLEVADSLHNLCIDLGDEGRRAESEATARRLLAMRREILGPEDPLVAAALADLAWATGSSGKLDEAISWQRQALEMQRKLLGDNAPDVAKSLNNLAQMLTSHGKLEEAHVLLQSALATQNQQLGEDNPNSLDTLRSLALVLEAEGKLAEAENLHRQALALWHERGESDTPKALSELESLCEILVTQKKFKEAHDLLEESLTPATLKQPSAADLLALRADLEARRCEWQKAATDATAAFNLQPLKNERYAMVAALLLKAQDRPAYEKFRQQLLANFAGTTNVYTADEVAKSCLFFPPAEKDLPVISGLADFAVKFGIQDSGALPFFEDGKALSEYRLGHFAAAIEWATKPLAFPHNYVHPHAYAVLAMAYWQLGKKDLAQAMLAKGDALAPPSLPDDIAMDSGNAWLAWLFARIQLNEATALISPDLNSGNMNPGPKS